LKTTGLFTIHEVVIEAKEGDTFKFIPFGDVHRDSSSFANHEWEQFLAYAKAQPKALFLGMGDYMDFASTSERTIIKDERLHESTRDTLNGVAKGIVKTLSNELSFMRGRMLGMIGGNHYYTFNDGDTSDHVLAASLGAKFLGVCSLIRVTFKCGKRSHSVSIDIMAHHGKGGGMLAGSSFNTVEKMQSVMEADIYLMGHDHMKGCIPARPRLRLTQGGGRMSVKERTPVLGRTGSFLKSYEPGMVNYNVDVCRSPCALGWIEFDLNIHRDRAGGNDELSVKIRSTT
jgi:hypothetical protein